MDSEISPLTLQRKVQFDIRFYFARRGCKNMEKMLKDDFKLCFDAKTETWFITKTHDELTKNHKGIEDPEAGLMPENRDDKMCLVHSFKMYINHLNEENSYVWQIPLQKVIPSKPNMWYSKQHYGRNTLATFMTEIFLNCGLSKMYTNHSIRVTGATIFIRMKFSASEIMAVTGHKMFKASLVTNTPRIKRKLRWETSCINV